MTPLHCEEDHLQGMMGGFRPGALGCHPPTVLPAPKGPLLRGLLTEGTFVEYLPSLQQRGHRSLTSHQGTVPQFRGSRV